MPSRCDSSGSACSFTGKEQGWMPRRGPAGHLGCPHTKRRWTTANPPALLRARGERDLRECTRFPREWPLLHLGSDRSLLRVARIDAPARPLGCLRSSCRATSANEQQKSRQGRSQTCRPAAAQRDGMPPNRRLRIGGDRRRCVPRTHGGGIVRPCRGGFKPILERQPNRVVHPNLAFFRFGDT